MVRITYIEANGVEHVVEVEPGLSVMKGAVLNGVPGILADCGGGAACGTCRVFVGEAWRDRTGEASDDEEAMLVLNADDDRSGQRLSCQIEVTEALDGLIVRMPERQF